MKQRRLVWGILICLWAGMFATLGESADAVRRNVLLPPGPGNPRNSEGDFIQLKKGHILFIYSHYYEGTGGDNEPRSRPLLATPLDIRQATDDALPLVAQTQISDKNTGLRAIIEFLIKTMNIRDEEPTYQVDTGPVALPDLGKRYDRSADCLALAFVAFNGPHFADFIIEDETPIVENGKEVARVYHYSRQQTFPADNRLFAIDR